MSCLSPSKCCTFAYLLWYLSYSQETSQGILPLGYSWRGGVVTVTVLSPVEHWWWWQLYSPGRGKSGPSVRIKAFSSHSWRCCRGILYPRKPFKSPLFTSKLQLQNQGMQVWKYVFFPPHLSPKNSGTFLYLLLLYGWLFPLVSHHLKPI